MRLPTPILVSHLFRELLGNLIALLRSLSAEDWHRPTVCSAWCVKDIASHLLDGNLRRLAAQRDGYASPDAPTGFNSDEALIAYLHRLNADWTAATRRVSPRSLITLLEVSGEEVSEMFESADPYGPASFPVAWAGESKSPMWFDIAREYTERWHHQRQIADAAGRATPIDQRHLHYPVLDTFMRALPQTYRDVRAPEGILVSVRVVGDAGGEWFVRNREGNWELLYEVASEPDAIVTIEQPVAWKFLTKRTDRATARERYPGIRITGIEAYGEPVLEMVSVMA